jgi:hypothetical protein
MEDLLAFVATTILLWVASRTSLPFRRGFLLSVSFLAFGELLDTLDELPFLNGVFILGRGGRFHEFAEDGIGRLVGFTLLLLWALTVRRYTRDEGGDEKGVSW